jgi:hypothetical protein
LSPSSSRPSMQARADRLHAAISKTFEGFYAAVERSELRAPTC